MALGPRSPRKIVSFEERFQYCGQKPPVDVNAEAFVKPVSEVNVIAWRPAGNEGFRIADAPSVFHGRGEGDEDRRTLWKFLRAQGTGCESIAFIECPRETWAERIEAHGFEHVASEFAVIVIPGGDLSFGEDLWTAQQLLQRMRA